MGQFAVFGLNSSLLVGLAVVYITIAVLALAAWPTRPFATLAALWVLAVVLFAFWLSQSDLGGGLFMNLYASSLLGSVAFVLWVGLGLVFWVYQGLPATQTPVDRR